MNSFAMLQALIFEPRKAFNALAERPRFLFPMLLTLIGTAGLVYWYYQVADLEWMMDRQLRTSAFTRDMPEQQMEETIRAAGQNPVVTGAVSAVTTAIGLTLIYALVSLYYLLAGKVTNVQRSFRQWFALAWWTNLPTLLTVITGAVVLLTATTAQIEEADLRALSFNSLIFHKSPGDPGYVALAYVGLPELLAIWLAIFGVRVWSGRSWLFSLVFTLLPAALIVGVVLLFTMGSS